MLQEPNAPPSYPPSILPACSSPRSPFARKPLLFRLFSFDCLPFSVSPFPAERRIPSSFPPSTPSSAPEEQPPPDLPTTSREFYKTFHASLTASTSFSPTKQRILVWIEFLMEPTPPGLRPHPLQPFRFPSPLSFVCACFHPRCTVILVRRVRAAWKYRNNFLLYRFLRARDIISNEVNDEKGAYLRKVKRVCNTYTLAYAKSEGSRLLFCIGDIRKGHNTMPRVSTWRWKKASFTPSFIL